MEAPIPSTPLTTIENVLPPTELVKDHNELVDQEKQQERLPEAETSSHDQFLARATSYIEF